MKEMIETGDVVYKKTGYSFYGYVRSVFQKGDGQLRCVVENFEGMMHIFNLDQLEIAPSAWDHELREICKTRGCTGIVVDEGIAYYIPNPLSNTLTFRLYANGKATTTTYSVYMGTDPDDDHKIIYIP